MSIQLKNEVRGLRDRIEQLERKMNLLAPERRSVGGQPEPDKEIPATKKRKRKG